MPTPLAVPVLCHPSPKSLRPSCPSATFVSNFSSPPRSVVVKCSNGRSQEGGIGDPKEALSALVNRQVDEVMNREENRELIKGLEKASERVDRARAELAKIEKQELEEKLARSQIDQLGSRLSEIEECQREILRARTMVEDVECSVLRGSGEVGTPGGMGDKDEERLESVKAAFISALIGTLAGLPVSLFEWNDSPPFLLDLAVTFICCALFGVTFRYAVRRDLGNVQLKSGTSAAFGFVKGLGMLAGGSHLELSMGSLLSNASDGAMYVAQNVYIYAVAAVGLDFCFKMRFLRPFPIRGAPSASENSGK